MEHGATLSLMAWGWFALLAVAGQWRPTTGAAHDALDPARVVTNIALGISDLAVSFAVPLALVASAALADWGHFGLLRWIGLSGFAGVVASLVLTDLVNWSVHRLSHGWSPLWRLHRVHHSDTSLDVLTTYRHHPLESLAAGAMQAAIVAALGLDPAGVAIYALVTAFLSPLLHSNVDWRVPLPVARAVCVIVMTPALHSLHHSAWRVETDSNYGQFLSVWDRLAGTLRTGRNRPAGSLEIGLGAKYRAGASRLMTQLLLPMAPVEDATLAEAGSATDRI